MPSETSGEAKAAAPCSTWKLHRVATRNRLLVIEGSPCPLRAALEELRSDELSFSCETADWRDFLPDSLLQRAPDLVVPVATDPLPDAQAFFQWLRHHPIAVPTLAVLPVATEHELLSDASAVVDDFILWPAGGEELRQRLARLLGQKAQDQEDVLERLTADMGRRALLGADPSFLRTVERLPLAARSDSPVLLTGETGTGKELFARAIHFLSKRRGFPFIPVDCGAFPDHLFENELFGHARGAFTDARGDQKGLVAMAEGGTLFLDEIDSLSLAAQAKLLRFLQERTYKPLGGDRFLRASVNVVAASNRDLESLVAEQRFRSDLYFRLNVLRMHLVPLRERRGDVEILARHFVRTLCMDAGVPHKTLTPAALAVLAGHDWPGNVRELFNVLQRAVAFYEGPLILPCQVSLPSAAPVEFATDGFRQARALAVEAFERTYVEDLLRKHHGNVTRAAREARKDRRVFGRLIRKHDINRLDG